MRAWPSLLATLLAACGGDAAHSPACGLALIAGPTLIQQQLLNARAVMSEAPRGLPELLPALVIQQRQANVRVGYDVDQRIVMEYAGLGFPTRGGYGLLVVDDTSQRAMGVIIYESQEPKDYPRLGSVTGGGATLNLYGVRVDWASVSNPRCPLLGAPPSASPPSPSPSTPPATS
ncbi:MAG TPA: hypothetical protein VGQ25_04980 [Gemmatimonadales bacterium]|jgi:hypothetical protein|nr:hypothetical protein [Gemmatimonadales bacterium]